MSGDSPDKPMEGNPFLQSVIRPIKELVYLLLSCAAPLLLIFFLQGPVQFDEALLEISPCMDWVVGSIEKEKIEPIPFLKNPMPGGPLSVSRGTSSL